MKIKRIFALFLCLTLFLTAIPMAQAAATYSPWFKSGYLEMEKLGLLPDSFKEADLTLQITRAEICDIAVPAIEAITGNVVEPYKTDYFTDATALNILKAYELGIVNGYEDGSFRPNQKLTRQEFFVVLVNFCLAASMTTSADASALASFPDKNAVASWAQSAAQVCVKYKFVSGVSTGSGTYLNPQSNLTRQEAMMMFLRCYKGLNEYYFYVKNASVVANLANVTVVDGVFVTPAKTTATVTASTLNVRSKPFTSGSKLGSLYVGAMVNVTGYCDNGWFQISYQNTVGYVSGEYIKVQTNGQTLVQSVASDKAVTICNHALQYVGYSYVYGGKSPTTGFDCSGLVYYVFGQNGYQMNRVANDQLKQGTPVEKSNLLAGDLVFFGYGNYADHVGIYIGGGNFVHASTPKSGVRISSLSETYYAQKYIGARRIVT